jgi:hypothetical protein
VLSHSENFSISKPLKASEKSQILSFDTLVANERYAVHLHQTLRLPEDDQDIWPKHVGALYNKHKDNVQLVDGEMFA